MIVFGHKTTKRNKTLFEILVYVKYMVKLTRSVGIIMATQKNMASYEKKKTLKLFLDRKAFSCSFMHS